ncbi:MAG: hypothetical protein JW969_06645 [Spirochaetales bacterium]|nr:hypothetical protein [Spirochaetales bacterium]
MMKKYYVLTILLLVAYPAAYLTAQAPPPQPTPEIIKTDPTENQKLSYTTNTYTIIVEAQDVNGIKEVVILVDGRLLVTNNTSPNVYEAVWQNIQSGSHVISIRVTNVNDQTEHKTFNISKADVPNLIARWKFDEKSGEEAADATGNGNTGILNNIKFADGIRDGCFYFDGSAFVQTSPGLMNNLRKFTVAGWIKPEQFGPKMSFFGQNDMFEFGLNSGTAILAWITNNETIDSVYIMPKNEWHHVTVVADGESVAFYVDGNLPNPESKKFNQTVVYGSSTDPFNIGGKVFNINQGEYFKGWIDDVRVYDTALEVRDIKELAAVNGNLRPSISFISPFNGQDLEGPLNLTLSVNADDFDGEIRSVEFYSNGQLLGISSSTASPYTFQWQGIMPKSYTMVAVAIDNGGLNAKVQAIMNVKQKENKILGYWSLNFEEGDVATDGSPNQNNGKIVGALRVPAIDGGGLRFTGESYVTVTKGLLNHLPAFTIAAWIKPESGGDHLGFAGQDGVIEFGFYSGNKITLYTAEGGTLECDYPYDFNEWHHIAAVGTGMGLFLYIDGELETEPDAAVQTTTDYGASDGYFNIGGGGIFEASGNYFPGCMDEVIVYSSALTKDEIKNMINRVASYTPSIKITQPVQTEPLNVAQEIIISADVLNRGTEILGMEFYINGELLTTVTTEPYMYQWKAAETGNVTIKARAQNVMGNFGEDSLTITIGESDGSTENDESSPEPADENPQATDALNPMNTSSNFNSNINREFPNRNTQPPARTYDNTQAVPTVEPPNIAKLKYYIATPLELEYIPEEYVDVLVENKIKKENQTKKQPKNTPTPSESVNTATPFVKIANQGSGKIDGQGGSFDSRLFIVIIPILLYILVVGLIFLRSRKKTQ